MTFRDSMRSKRVAVGGEAATVTRTGVGSLVAEGEAQRRVQTVGAALKWVIASVRSSRQIVG